MTNGDQNEVRFRKTERVDLVICTWNRKEQLVLALASVFRMIVPYDLQLRLVVVNNGSTDGTEAYLEQVSSDRFFKRHELLVLNESQQGHTHARNRAIANLDSDLVMWTDDDVTVGSRWVQETVIFADAHPEAAFFGGKIMAHFEPAPPTWITENWPQLKGCFAERDLGDEVLTLSPNQLPYGANFAVRTSVQKQFLFDTELGRRGDEVLGEDELDVFRRWLSAGWQGLWNPKSTVDHRIDSTRINEEFIRRYFIGQGRAIVKKGEPWHDDARRMWWTSFGHYLRFRFQRHFAASPAWLAHLIRSGLAEGQYAELKDRQ